MGSNTCIQDTGSGEGLASDGLTASLDLSYERFSTEDDWEVLQQRGQFSRSLERSRSNPDPSPCELPFKDRARTSVSVIRFPDGDVQITGCHVGVPSNKSRPRATEEEKQKKACSRARRTIKNTAKFFEHDHLWTLTYRGPHSDLALVYGDFAKFVRIVRETFPEFAALAVAELHLGGGPNHGGIHVHFSVKGFYDVKVLRAAWWRVVGEGQGNVDVQGPKGNVSPRLVGNYLAKYI